MTLSLKLVFVFLLLTSPHLDVYSQEPSGLALYSQGVEELKKNQDNGVETLSKAARLSLQTGDHVTYIRSLTKLVSLDYYERDEQASHVLELVNQSENIIGKAQPSEEVAHFYVASANFYEGFKQHTAKAIAFFNKGIQSWIALRGMNDAEVAACYHSLGDIYKYTTFDFYSAEKAYETALAIRTRIGLKDPVVLYRNYYSLAATNGSQLDFAKAVAYANEALRIVQSLEPRRQEQCEAMVANIYRDMGRIEEAKTHYFNALSLNRQTKNLDNRAWYYLCLGEMFKNEVQPVEALNYFQLAYDLYKLPGSSDHTLFLSLLISMFDVYSATYPPDIATDVQVNGFETKFNQIRKEIFHELATADMMNSTEAANAWLIIGKYHAGKASYDSALYAYQQALISSIQRFNSEDILENPTVDVVGFQYYVNDILTRKASALKVKFEKTADVEYLNASLECLRLAERLLSKQRNTLDMEDSKLMFMEKNFDLYETIIESLYEAKGRLHFDSINQYAFEYFEKSKSRSLADALTLTERDNLFNDQDTLFRVQADLKKRLLTSQVNLTRGVEKSADPEELSEYRNEIVEIDRQLQIVKNEIENKYPGYFNVKYGSGSAIFSDVRKLLKENDQALVEFFWGTNAVYIFGATRDITIFERVGSPDSVKNLINNLLIQLGARASSTDVERYNQFCDTAFKLYGVLLGPIAMNFREGQRIQIIPDGPISQVPFEILLFDKANSSYIDYRSLKYLLRRHPIGYAYSSSMLSQSAQSGQVSQPTVLAMGFTDGQAVRESDVQLSRIAGAEDELHALGARFSSGKFLLGADANELNFKSLAPKYDIIHLAVHGRGDVDKSYAASLYFGNKVKNEDGELHAYELYGLKLKALMAVLSSCESGLGKGYRGEGMISMASAFTYSGCKNILMSLWKVNDQAAMTLMDDFYGYLLEGKTIDDALRQAKLKYLESADELTADPRIWTPLVAYGNLYPIFRKDNGNVWIYGGLIVMSAIIFISWKMFKAKRTA